MKPAQALAALDLEDDSATIFYNNRINSRGDFHNEFDNNQEKESS